MVSEVGSASADQVAPHNARIMPSASDSTVAMYCGMQRLVPTVDGGDDFVWIGARRRVEFADGGR
jgi:hypothetical protein